MHEIQINHFEKGLLSERDSKFRRIHEGWKRIFKDCAKNEAVLLENKVKSVSLLEAGASSDIGGYDGFVLNLVRRVYANMISKELVSVQPMSAPTGLVFYLDPQVMTGTTTDFQSMFDSHYDSQNYDVSKGSYTLITSSTVSISATNYNSGTSFNIPYSGGMDGLTGLQIKVTGSSEQLIYAISPTTWGQDFISNNTINIIAHQSGTSLTGTQQAYSEWRDYSSQEGTSTMQEIKLNVVTDNVTCTSRKLKGKFTEELSQDMESYFGLGLESELAELMSLEIASEIDREIIRDLITIAPYRDEWHYDMYSMSSITGSVFFSGDVRDISGQNISGVTKQKWAMDSLMTKINKMDGQIRKANIYHGANWLICSTKVGVIIETMPEHHIEKQIGLMDVERIHKTGKLKSTIDVYVDPYLPDNILLIGYNGSNWDAGYIYAPYSLSDIQKIIDPDTLFEGDMEFMCRYAKKIVTNKKYGLIDCKFTDRPDELIVNGV